MRKGTLAIAAGLLGLTGIVAAPTKAPALQTSDGTGSATIPRDTQATAATVSAPAFIVSSRDFPNPERGFYRALRSSNLDAFSQADATDGYDRGFRLLYARIDLEAYRNADTLPTAYLDKLKAGLGYARAAGIKLIVRAVYNFPDDEVNYHAAVDAPLARVRKHIAQIGPVLSANSDVVAFVQAGYAGAWGEWHTSSNGLLDTAASRAALEQALLAGMPSSRFVQFRYPRYLREWAPELPPLSAAIGGDFRLGFHNDCFLASIEDVGTFSTDPAVRASEQAYADRLGDLGPVGGETCNSTWEPTAVRRSACADILKEGARYNFTYLNIGYWRPGFHDMWQAHGCMPTIRNKLGYRFELRSASHASMVAAGATFTVRFTINNSGWARLYNARPLQVILLNMGTNAATRITATGTDPRTWVPGSTRAEISAAVPADLATGSYRVLLALPDGSASIADDPRYAIRFADDDDRAHGQYWDSALGAFAIGTTVRIG